MDLTNCSHLASPVSPVVSNQPRLAEITASPEPYACITSPSFYVSCGCYTDHPTKAHEPAALCSTRLARDAVEQQPLARQVGPPHAHLLAFSGCCKPAAQHVPLDLPHACRVLQSCQLLSLCWQMERRCMPGLWLNGCQL